MHYKSIVILPVGYTFTVYSCFYSPNLFYPIVLHGWMNTNIDVGVMYHTSLKHYSLGMNTATNHFD